MIDVVFVVAMGAHATAFALLASIVSGSVVDLREKMHVVCAQARIQPAQIARILKLAITTQMQHIMILVNAATSTALVFVVEISSSMLVVFVMAMVVAARFCRGV